MVEEELPGVTVGFVRKSDIWFVLKGEKRGLFLTLIGIVV